MRLRHGEKSGPQVLLVRGGAGGHEGDEEVLRRRREAMYPGLRRAIIF
jgi:hypothetical protein